MFRSAFIAVALCLAPVWSVSGAENPFEGLPVTHILFIPAAQPISPARLKELIAVRVGAPLEGENLSKSIKQMFATGRYSDIQVDAERSGNGVRISFITSQSWFVGAVRVLNVEQPPTAAQLVAATNLVLGETYSDEKMKAATEALRALLAENGLYKASIRVETKGHPDTQQLDITFLVTPGPRAGFGDIRLPGQADVTPQQVRHITRWSRGRRFTQPAVERGMARLQKYYQRTDHLMAAARVVEREYVPGTRLVNLTIEIDPGPRVEVALSGAKLSQKELRRLVPIYEEGSVDRDLLAEGARNLRDYFQTQGYFEAKVDYDEHPEENGVVLVEFQATLGEPHEFVRLEIDGERYFDEETIRERMLLQPKGLHMRRGRFSQNLLSADIAAIQDLYRSNGFLSAKVEPRVADDYQGRKGEIAVFLRIEEGPQTLVSRLTITGNQAISTQELLSRASSLPGQPFSTTNVAGDRDQILDLYFGQGFADATLEWSSTPAAEPNRVNVEYTIHEGRRQFVNRVIVEGYENTRPYIIDRQIQIENGQPLSQEAMLESQRRLYDLGIFSKVDMAIQNPEGEEQYRNVLFETLEARRWTVGVGGGAEIGRIGGSTTSLDAPAGANGFSPRVSLEVNRLNMFGRANTLSFQSRVSNFDKRVLARYTAPQWRGKERLTLTYNSLFDQSVDIRTFSATRLEGGLQLQHRISKTTSLFYRYTYRHVTVDAATLKINPLLIPLFSQPVRVGLLSASLFQDRRDDPVDATRGMYNSIDLGSASYYTGSADTFARLLMQNSTYYPLTKRLVLARTTQFGAMVPYGRLRRVETSTESGATEVTFTREIPLPERFFAGGPNSIRAFPINQAGPRDLVTGFPVGGTGLFFNSVELRFPVRGPNLGGVLFHDMGNVYSKLQNISFRVTQRKPEFDANGNIVSEDFDYMVHAVGLGVRYRTPIGPVRLDVAYGLNPPRFFGFKGSQEDLLFGRGTKTNQRISHFQFHFSLGQTF